MRKVHAENIFFKCSYCDQEFEEHSHFKSHLRLHLNMEITMKKKWVIKKDVNLDDEQIYIKNGEIPKKKRAKDEMPKRKRQRRTAEESVTNLVTEKKVVETSEPSVIMSEYKVKNNNDNKTIIKRGRRQRKVFEISEDDDGDKNINVRTNKRSSRRNVKITSYYQDDDDRDNFSDEPMTTHHFNGSDSDATSCKDLSQIESETIRNEQEPDEKPNTIDDVIFNSVKIEIDENVEALQQLSTDTMWDTFIKIEPLFKEEEEDEENVPLVQNLIQSVPGKVKLIFEYLI